jgi:hypothetical protein
MTDKEKLRAIEEYVRERKEIYLQELNETQDPAERAIWSNSILALDGVGEILDR